MQKIMINQEINQEILSGRTTTLTASRSVFQTVIVLKIQRLQFRSQSFVPFLIQYTLTKKRILSPENTKNWERECYGITLFIANVDMKVLVKNKYFWYSEHVHFDITINGSPPKSVVFIIQCSELRSN